MLNIKNVGKLAIICGCCCYFTPTVAQDMPAEQQQNTTVQEAKTESSVQPVVEVKGKLSSYTWDDFLNGKDCQDLIKELEDRSDYTELYQNLKNFCVSKSSLPWDNLLNTFRKEKKYLLFNQVRNNKVSYTEYLKVLPDLLFDVQDMNASGNTPRAVLDQIEQAIIDQQPTQIIKLLEQMPDNWKNSLKQTQKIADRIVQFKEQLENLNSFEKGAEND